MSITNTYNLPSGLVSVRGMTLYPPAGKLKRGRSPKAKKEMIESLDLAAALPR